MKKLSWDKVSIKKYIEVYKIPTEIQDETKQSFRLVEVLYDIPDASKLPVAKFVSLLTAATELLNTQPNPSAILDQLPNSRFKFTPSASKLTAGNFLAFENYCRQGDVLGQLGVIYGAECEEDIEFISNQLTVPESLAVLSFFMKASEVLKNNIKYFSKLPEAIQIKLITEIRQGETVLLYGTPSLAASGKSLV